MCMVRIWAIRVELNTEYTRKARARGDDTINDINVTVNNGVPVRQRELGLREKG